MILTKPILFIALALAAQAQEPPRLSPAQAAAICQLDPAPADPAGMPRAASFAPLLDKVTPSVVSVFPATIASEGDTAGPLERYFGSEEKSEDSPKELIRGVGSGVIISPDGWIVTNSHVVHLVTGRIADTFFVELHDHRRFHAKIAGVDPLTDLALLKIDAPGLAPLKFADSEKVQAGDLVFAVGNPFQVGITCTMGMVSATRRSSIGVGGEGSFESFIQTDAAINPGNSGGALIDASGRLVGINTAILGGSGGNVGIGFAIPSNLVRHIAARLAEEGKITRGFFGLSTVNVDDAGAVKVKLPRVAGAVVESVMDGSPAAKAGLTKGDVVIKAAGKEVISRGDLRFELSFLKAGESIELVYWRDGAEHAAKVVAAAEPTKGAPGQPNAASRLDVLPGVAFRQIEEQVTVTEVTSATAKRAGLEAGMIIVSVNGTKITNMALLESSIKNGINKVQATSNGVLHTLALRAE